MSPKLISRSEYTEIPNLTIAKNDDEQPKPAKSSNLTTEEKSENGEFYHCLYVQAQNPKLTNRPKLTSIRLNSKQQRIIKTSKTNQELPNHIKNYLQNQTNQTTSSKKKSSNVDQEERNTN